MKELRSSADDHVIFNRASDHSVKSEINLKLLIFLLQVLSWCLEYDHRIRCGYLSASFDHCQVGRWPFSWERSESTFKKNDPDRFEFPHKAFFPLLFFSSPYLLHYSPFDFPLISMSLLKDQKQGADVKLEQEDSFIEKSSLVELSDEEKLAIDKALVRKVSRLDF